MIWIYAKELRQAELLCLKFEIFNFEWFNEKTAYRIRGLTRPIIVHWECEPIPGELRDSLRSRAGTILPLPCKAQHDTH